jgi:putative signal transducing protein
VLEVLGRPNCLAGRVENCKRLVAPDLDDPAAAHLDAFSDEVGKLGRQASRRFVAGLLCEPRVAAHVGNEERAYRCWFGPHLESVSHDVEEWPCARTARASRYARGVEDAVRLTTIPGEPEAEALCGLLRSAGIECAHRQTPEPDSPFEGIATDGQREILVHEADLERARELIAGTGP